MEYFKSKTSFISGRFARSIFYIVFVGGLFTFSSILLRFVCNRYFTNYFDIPEMSLLEASGIISFFYIAFFGFYFGFSPQNDNTALGKVTDVGCNQARDEQCRENGYININKMTPSEKSELQRKLEKILE